MNIPQPMEVRTSKGTYVLTADNCVVCTFPEPFKQYEHVFISSLNGARSYIFSPKLVKKVRTNGFPLYWRPYPTEMDRKAFSDRAMSLQEIARFNEQLELGVNWEELDEA